MKELVKVTCFGLFLLFATIMIAGPTAGEHSLAYKVSMSIYMGKY